MGCAFPKCHNEDILTWLTKPLCQKHWDFVCEHREEAEKKLNLKTTGATKEELAKKVEVERMTQELDAATKP